MNHDTLYAIQDHSLFMKGRTFMSDKLAVPGGLLDWAGCFLVQFFYYPWIGSTVLLLVWIVSVIITIRAFCLKDLWTLAALLPVTALLCSVVDMGYWIYYQKLPGYCFSQSLGYLVMLLAIWGCDFIEDRCRFLATPYIIIWTILGYCAFGWWALLGTLVMGLCRGCNLCNRLVSIFSVALVPWLAYHCYSQFRIEDAWLMGFPVFQQGEFVEWRLSMPFFAIAVFVLAFSWLNGKLMVKSRIVRYSMAFVILSACVAAPFTCNVNDSNFHSELRMYRAMDESRWQDVVDEYEKNKSVPTHQMVMMKNTALSHLGLLGERMYDLGNCGQRAQSGMLKVRMSVTVGPMLYYQNGLVNFAYRWGIENEVERGLSVKQLKMLARCAIWNEENELALKYLAMLKSTLFHRSWAREREQMVYNVGAFRESEEFKAIAPLVVQGDGDLDFDSGLCEEYIINNFAYLLAQNIRQQEAAVCYAMMLKDDELMKFQIANYYALNGAGNVPKHILEAVDLLNKEHSPAYQQFLSDYRTSLGMGRKMVDVGKDMKVKYAKSYWWYYYFYNDFNIY